MGGLPTGAPQSLEGIHTQTKFPHVLHVSPSSTSIPLFSSSLMHPNTQTGPTSQAGAGIQLLSLCKAPD